MTKEDIILVDSEMLFCDGFDDAIVGIAQRIGMEQVVAYDTKKIIEILMNRDGMNFEDAVEYFYFNIVGAWVGDKTPIFLDI